MPRRAKRARSSDFPCGCAEFHLHVRTNTQFRLANYYALHRRSKHSKASLGRWFAEGWLSEAQVFLVRNHSAAPNSGFRCNPRGWERLRLTFVVLSKRRLAAM